MTPPRKDDLLAVARRHRAGMARRAPPVTPEPVGPGEESVWDFPRPPEVRAVAAPLRVEFAGRVVAATAAGRRICETASAPVYVFPPSDVATELLQERPDLWSVCEWKGAATYFDLVAGDRRSEAAAFTYADPFDDLGRGYGEIAGWLAFYADRVDAAFVGDERVRPQPGGFYAGWVTPGLRGPIKGAPGSGGW
jgi:uncharacterized protein (DUF427 family)